LIPAVVTLLVWETVVLFEWVNVRLIPPPIEVWRELVSMVMSGLLLQDIAISTQRAVLGFFFGSVAGIVLGLLTGRSSLSRAILEPSFNWMRSLPALALLPLLIIWFGLGEDSKVILIAYGVTWPLWVNVHVSSRDPDPDVVDAARVDGAHGWSLLVYIIIPLITPFIVSGMRTGAALSFILLVAAELMGAASGIGYRLEEAHMVFRVSRMLVMLGVLGIMGVTVDYLFKKATQKWVE
jgi:ABC-type nitrate/sulfonate/bicarbonate transport system permease component